MINTLIHKIKKSDYTLFSTKIIIFIILLVSFDFIIGKTLDFFYFKQNSGAFYRTTYSIEKTDQDILIFGSSRANHHYRPDIFEKQLHLSCYNVGREGCFIFYNYAVLKSVLKRHSPKIIILDIVSNVFEKEQGSYDNLSSLLPYYNSHPEIHDIIELKSPFEKIKLLSSIYPFNSSVLTIAAGNTNFNMKRTYDIKGYVPLSGKWNKPIKLANSEDYELDSNKVKVFESFIQDCQKSQTKLYVICSPNYEIFNQNDPSYIQLKSITKKYKIDFFDHYNDPLFNNGSLFNDPLHMNDDGAKIFSEIIAKKISDQNSYLYTTVR